MTPSQDQTDWERPEAGEREPLLQGAYTAFHDWLWCDRGAGKVGSIRWLRHLSSDPWHSRDDQHESDESEGIFQPQCQQSSIGHWTALLIEHLDCKRYHSSILLLCWQKKQHILASLRKAERNNFVPSGLVLKSFLNTLVRIGKKRECLLGVDYSNNGYYPKACQLYRTGIFIWRAEIHFSIIHLGMNFALYQGFHDKL